MRFFMVFLIIIMNILQSMLYRFCILIFVRKNNNMFHLNILKRSKDSTSDRDRVQLNRVTL